MINKGIKYIVLNDSKFPLISLLDEALKIKNKQDAKEYKNLLIKRQMTLFKQTKKEAVNTINDNIGYYSGYYNKEIAKRVMNLFNCKHPVWGKKIPDNYEEAFKIGLEYSKKIKTQMIKKNEK